MPGCGWQVPFQEVPDLVAQRKVLVRKGFAFVPANQLASIVTGLFRAHLSKVHLAPPSPLPPSAPPPPISARLQCEAYSSTPGWRPLAAAGSSLDLAVISGGIAELRLPPGGVGLTWRRSWRCWPASTSR